MHSSLLRMKRKNEHIAYVPAALVLTTLPHSRVDSGEYVRRNGHHLLTITAPAIVGIPYGVIPRLLLIWIATQVKLTRTRDINLGDSCRQFLHQLGIQSTGGKTGSIGRLRRQMASLLQCSISVSRRQESHDFEMGMRLTDFSSLWWMPTGELTRQNNILRISELFYLEIVANSFPVDMRAIKVLRKSPMALDVYMWLTYRVYSLRRPCVISWEELSQQFGSKYTRLWHFEMAFTKYLERVKKVYPELIAYSVRGKGLHLYPSRTHIPSACG